MNFRVLMVHDFSAMVSGVEAHKICFLCGQGGLKIDTVCSCSIFERALAAAALLPDQS